MPAPTRPLSVVFVCTGNICRSPMAEVVLAAELLRVGLAGQVEVDSAGIGDWHVGEQADPRALRTLSKHGFDGSHLRARQFDSSELATSDLVIVMDAGHRDVLRTYTRDPEHHRKIRLLRSYDPQAPHPEAPVFDPYYGEEEAFDLVLEQVLASVPGIVEAIRTAIAAGRKPA